MLPGKYLVADRQMVKTDHRGHFLLEVAADVREIQAEATASSSAD
jgi:hypothetical protein